VSALHTATPIAITVRRDPRSARRAIGTPISECTSTNASPVSRPSDASETAKSSLICCSSTATIWRSTKLNRFTATSTAST
jgi:hypothetical protein